MIITSLKATKNINHLQRKEIAMAIREIRCGMYKYKDAEPKCPCDYCEEQEIKDSKIGKVLRILGIFATMVFIILLLSHKAHAQEIPDQKAVKSIIGEAENQGFEGLLAIAHAIRNRGTLKGVYGLHAPRVKRHLYSREILKEATLAWQQSAVDFDITHGATGWGNAQDVKQFEMCRWWGHCIVTIRIKDHVFYKEQK